jgi:hypothetical protein
LEWEIEVRFLLSAIQSSQNGIRKTTPSVWRQFVAGREIGQILKALDSNFAVSPSAFNRQFKCTSSLSAVFASSVMSQNTVSKTQISASSTSDANSVTNGYTFS